MSKKHKELFMGLNYTEALPVLYSEVTGCVSISAFVLLVAIPRGTTSSAVVSKICVITVEVRSRKRFLRF